MNRRDFITLLGGAAVWPLAARAQQPAVPVVGFLGTGSEQVDPDRVAAFKQGLNEAGYIDGRNVTIEYRWAQNDIARLPTLAADLVNRRVSVIAAPFSTPAALAAKSATATIPIVFSSGADPVQLGLVVSLNRPGGNVTGLTYLAVQLAAKRLELLHDLIPQATHFALLINPSNPLSDSLIRVATGAASAIGVQFQVFTADTDRAIGTAFSDMRSSGIEGLQTGPDTLFSNNRDRLNTFAARQMLPAIYPFRDHVETGGLMSYGASPTEEYRLVGGYVGRILGGAKPAELPVLQPTKFELVINLRTAKALGLTVPQSLLYTAEVIE